MMSNYKWVSNFPHKLILTNTQDLRLSNAFTNNSSANIKLLSAQLHKIGQLGGFSGRLKGPLLRTRLSLIGNVLKPLAKSVLIPSELTAAALATDSAVHQKMFESGMRPHMLASQSFVLSKANIIDTF